MTPELHPRSSASICGSSDSLLSPGDAADPRAAAPPPQAAARPAAPSDSASPASSADRCRSSRGGRSHAQAQQRRREIADYVFAADASAFEAAERFGVDPKYVYECCREHDIRPRRVYRRRVPSVPACLRASVPSSKG